MSTAHIIDTVFEICMVAFLFWGFLHEDKFARFEKKIMNRIKKKFESKKER